MHDRSTNGYTATQVALHWFVFAAVVFLFITGDSTTQYYIAQLSGTTTTVSGVWMPVHLIVGLAILAAMVWRLVLRRRIGVPAPPAEEPIPLRWLAQGVHIGLYLDLIAASIIGLLVDFGVSGLAWTHALLTRQVLIVLVGLHVAGALWHAIYWRDDVLQRMLRPSRSPRK